MVKDAATAFALMYCSIHKLRIIHSWSFHRRRSIVCVNDKCWRIRRRPFVSSLVLSVGHLARANAKGVSVFVSRMSPGTSPAVPDDVSASDTIRSRHRRYRSRFFVEKTTKSQHRCVRAHLVYSAPQIASQSPLTMIKGPNQLAYLCDGVRRRR